MERILTSIDVGTSKVLTTVVKMNNGRIVEVLGTGLVPSHGIHRAIVLDIEEPTAAIRESVAEAEASSGTRVKSAFVGITGHHIGYTNNRGAVTVKGGDSRVKRRDLDRVMKSSREVPLPEDARVIHAIPRQYYLDGEPVLGSPLGLHGHRLEVETHVVTAGVTFIQNLVKCVEGAGVEVRDLVLEALASGEAVLEDAEKDGGVVLADIGAGTTDITVFRGRAIWYSRALPVGGYNVTRDIALGLGIPFQRAEELKITFGSALLPRDVQPQTVGMDADGGHGVSHRDLCYIIRSRLEEAIGMIFAELPRVQWMTWEPTALVLCGGTSNLPGIDKLGQQVLHQPVRVGRPTCLPEGVQGFDDPAYATGLGLLLWGSKYGGAKAATTESLLRRFFDQVSRWRLQDQLSRLRLNERVSNLRLNKRVAALRRNLPRITFGPPREGDE